MSDENQTEGQKAVVRSNVERGLTLVGDLADEFSEFLNRDKASISSGGWPWISTRGSSPEMKLGSIESDNLEVIIVGANRCNMYYDKPFEPGVFAAPKCFAIADPKWGPGEVEEHLAPPEDLASRESDNCSRCRMNAFGSASRGRGKACSNTVRLALLPANAQMLEKVEGAMLSVPPTSLKSYFNFARAVLNGLSRPLGTVVTKIQKVPNRQGAGFTFHFEMLRAIQDEEVLRKILIRMRGDAYQALQQPPPVPNREDGGGGGGATIGSDGKARRKVVRQKKSKTVGGDQPARAPRAR